MPELHTSSGRKSDAMSAILGLDRARSEVTGRDSGYG